MTMRVICWPHQEGLYMYVWVAALVLVAAYVLVLVATSGAAFGVFFGFQVTDLDRFLGFFSLCHFMFPSY